MSKAKIQSGDTVKVISGNYKGTIGVVTKVIKKVKPNGKLSLRASVNSIPKIAKYRKSQTYQGQSYPGAILQADRTVDISNIALLDDKEKVSKIKIEINDGKKTRFYKSTGKIVSKVKIEKTSKINSIDEAKVLESADDSVMIEKVKKISKKTNSSKSKE